MPVNRTRVMAAIASRCNVDTDAPAGSHSFAPQAWNKMSETSGWAIAFRHWGYPAWFRITIGVIEGLAGILLLWSRTAIVGAVLIIVVMLGGTATHLLKDHGRHSTERGGAYHAGDYRAGNANQGGFTRACLTWSRVSLMVGPSAPRMWRDKCKHSTRSPRPRTRRAAPSRRPGGLTKGRRRGTPPIVGMRRGLDSTRRRPSQLRRRDPDDDGGCCRTQAQHFGAQRQCLATESSVRRRQAHGRATSPQ